MEENKTKPYIFFSFCIIHTFIDDTTHTISFLHKRFPKNGDNSTITPFCANYVLFDQ